MIDISIPDIRKVFKTKKAQDLFMEQHVVVHEKMDGTKLTLVRNSLPRDRADYSRNWTVSYKGNVITREELAGVTPDMYEHSVGMCQYKRVFDHLKKLPSNLDRIPGCEFFIEFIQNKPTLTCDYERFGDMFLLASDVSESLLSSHGFRVVTSGAEAALSAGQAQAQDDFQFRRPVQVFRGRLSDEFTSFDAMIERFSNLPSCLGPLAEGVVMKIYSETYDFRMKYDTNGVYKVVRSDQYDKATRRAKKLRYALEEPYESEYWHMMNVQARSIVENHFASRSPFSTIERVSKIVYALSERQLLASNGKKHQVIKKDDLMLTCKMYLENRLTIETIAKTTVGVVALAGRPIHAGHWCLIERAARECKRVVLFLSTKGRGEGPGRIEAGRMVKVWKELLAEQLPRNVDVRFVDSPTYDAKCFMGTVVRQGFDVEFRVYGDETDIETDWNVNDLYKSIKGDFTVTTCPVKRKDTVNVSGTQMREWLANGDTRSFISNLPGCLSSDEKRRYLSLLLS